VREFDVELISLGGILAATTKLSEFLIWHVVESMEGMWSS
jgi:hypothetical protein